jgi:Lar family restriction alleviation protein
MTEVSIKQKAVLLPCPFCGDDGAMAFEMSEQGHSFWEVYCLPCTASVQEKTQEQAIAAWNTRQPHTDALKIAQDAIIAVRHNAASTFTEDYDKAVLDCHAAVTAALKESK